MAPTARLRAYGGRLITVDGSRVVELIDPNDGARRRFQYRRSAEGIERRVLTADGSPFRDTGSPWEPLSWLDRAALEAVRGTYHPILDSLGLEEIIMMATTNIVDGTTRVDPLDIVRQRVGRRSRITRDEMAGILAALPDLVASSTITGRDATGCLYVGGAWIEPVLEDRPAAPGSPRGIDPLRTARRERDATAQAWTRRCRDLTVISVTSHSVRFDETGSMAPGHHARIMFVDAAQVWPEHNPVGYLRRRADRVLVVTGS